ncbi:hypothetical protein BGZ46_002654 [Entomortierella lignicola]|nr:hypothetical protein BGZ46_002654 [Entomortierella lignicola]
MDNQDHQEAANARSHSVNNQQGRQQATSQSNTPNHFQHQNHIQFISTSPLPNPRQLFPDTSRTRRAFHLANGINSSRPMTVNTSNANAAAHQSGFTSPGPGTPKQKQVPLRTTKVSQKLVLLPEDQEEADDDDTDIAEDDFSSHVQDSFHDEIDFRKRRRGLHGRAPTHSELLTKEQRNTKGLARVVAYCTADGYDIKRLTSFLKANHGVQPRLYDEALYVAYHFPLIPGKTTRYMSAPPIRSPGGGSILDKQLEQYEENTGDDYSRSPDRAHERGRFRPSGSGRDLANEEYHQYLENEGDAIGSGTSTVSSRRLKNRRTGSRTSRHTLDDRSDLIMTGHEIEHSGQSSSTALEHDYFSESIPRQDVVVKSPAERQADSIETMLAPSQSPAVAPFMGGEIFFFDYGVVVFWNMTVEQENWILSDISQFEIKRLMEEDVQAEEFHFEYAGYSTPRIYNDMITLRGGNHMIKLTISHAISQSVKLALYECQMDDTIDDTKIIPIQLAQTGKLMYSRPQITKISGHLFQLRMNVDLVSNVLDTPEIFWSEPELQPLYDAIRGYLEIGQRAKVLSDRCLVISDLLTMLRDDLASNNMNYITWIIIILIVIAVLVAAGEIVVKYLSHFGGDGEHC